jgi:hypothetical protein
MEVSVRVRCLAICLAVSLPVTAFAASMKIFVAAEHEGAAVEQAEVCLYAAEFAKPFIPFDAPETRCLPANTILDVPPERFAHYVRQGDRLITKNHAYVSATVETDVFRRTTADLSVGGHLLFSRELAQNEGMIVILGEAPNVHGMVAPLLVEGRRALVAADVPLVPVLLRDGRAVWAGERVELQQGGERIVNLDTAGTDRSSVLVSVTGDDTFAVGDSDATSKLAYSPDFLRLLSKQSEPRVELVDAAGQIHTSEITGFRPENIFVNLYVFRNVSRGDAVLRISGPRYVTTEAKMKVTDERVVLARDAGRVVLGSQIVAEVASAAAGIKPTPRQCESPDAETDDLQRTIVLWRCPQSLAGTALAPSILSRCKEVERHQVAETGGIAAFDGLQTAEFLVTLERAGMVTTMVRAETAVGSTTTLPISGDELFVAGSLTREKKPAHARVIFSTGEAAADPYTGQYSVLLSRLPGRQPVHVIACDESWMYVHFPDDEIPAGAGYDITVPTNALAVTVRDGVTKKAIEGARLSAHAEHPKKHPGSGGQVPTEAQDGQYVIENLAEGSSVALCASHRGYKRTCTEVTVVEGRTEIEITLQPEFLKGRVTGPGYSVLSWVQPNGTLAHEVAIDGDGRFTYDRPWNEGHVVLTGQAPLFVLASPTFDGDELVITPPAPAPTKTISLSLSAAHPQRTAVVGVWLNGLHIPTTVLSRHLLSRRQNWFASKGRPLVLQDVFAADVVSVVAGPEVEFLGAGGVNSAAPFAGRTPVPVRTNEFVIE